MASHTSSPQISPAPTQRRLTAQRRRTNAYTPRLAAQHRHRRRCPDPHSLRIPNSQKSPRKHFPYPKRTLPPLRWGTVALSTTLTVPERNSRLPDVTHTSQQPAYASLGTRTTQHPSTHQRRALDATARVIGPLAFRPALRLRNASRPLDPAPDLKSANSPRKVFPYPIRTPPLCSRTP
jgi:hypothetical protein